MVAIEKETKLKEYMLMMGLSRNALWASWYLHYFLLLIIPCLLTMVVLTGNLSSYGSVLQMSDPFIVFIFLMLWESFNQLSLSQVPRRRNRELHVWNFKGLFVDITWIFDFKFFLKSKYSVIHVWSNHLALCYSLRFCQKRYGKSNIRSWFSQTNSPNSVHYGTYIRRWNHD